MKRLVPTLVLLGFACAIRQARTSGQSGEPCSSNDQCDTGVCFLGECRSTAAALSVVHAEVHGSDAQYGTLQTQGFDLRQLPVKDFDLVPVLSIAGRVVQRSSSAAPDAPVPGAAVVFADVAAPIPDRAVVVSTQSDSNQASIGQYTMRLPASTYGVLVAPPGLPEAGPFGPITGSTTSLDLVLPPQSLLTHVHGVLVVNGTDRLGGAQVTATDSAGTSISSPQISLADGSFDLTLPPGPPTFTLQVGPPSSSSAADPLPTFAPSSFSANHPPDLGTVDLGTLPASAPLRGSVVDARGAAVAGARVFVLSSGGSGVLARQATTLPDGSFSLQLRAGSYLLEVAPDPDPAQPAITDAIPVDVSASGTNLPDPIRCPDKIQVTGVVQRPDGRPAPAGLRVEATRLADRLVASRVVRATTTDSRGNFGLVMEHGQYRVQVTPPADAELPRTIVTIDVPATGGPLGLSPLQISPPHDLLGTVRAGGAPVSGATVDFYAIDATGKQSVLIGSAVADSAGRYKVVLPDVSQPAGP